MAGSEGLPYAIEVLEALRRALIETHLVMTDTVEATLGTDVARVRELADQVYAPFNQAARISSGSFLTRGMVVVPCDARSVAAIAMGLATNLVYRAADVTLKEQRPLVLALPSAPVTEIERLNLDRARQVPRLSVVTLVGTPEEGATAVLDQLSAVRD
jgi:polyprenyl P-hydroxybenzoate/phenylacrylic acid decarboxylase-like protein